MASLERERGNAGGRVGGNRGGREGGSRVHSRVGVARTRVPAVKFGLDRVCFGDVD